MHSNHNPEGLKMHSCGPSRPRICMKNRATGQLTKTLSCSSYSHFSRSTIVWADIPKFVPPQHSAASASFLRFRAHEEKRTDGWGNPNVCDVLVNCLIHECSVRRTFLEPLLMQPCLLDRRDGRTRDRRNTREVNLGMAEDEK